MPLFQTLARYPELMERSAAPRQVEIPPTDRQHYITGIYALNVHAPDGSDTSGDWHDVFHWREGLDYPAEVWVAGHEPSSDTNPIYGDMGVYEGKDRLASLEIDPAIHEVWIADHFRAILDMLYRSLKRYDAVYNLNGATEDWLDTPEQKDFVLTQAMRLSNSLTPKQQAALAAWIDYERHDDGSRGGNGR